MIKWLQKFKYKSVHTQKVSCSWGCGSTASVIVIFKEDGFGRRKLVVEGSLLPAKLEEHPYWCNTAVPWREYTDAFSKDTDDIPRKNNVVPFKVVK